MGLNNLIIKYLLNFEMKHFIQMEETGHNDPITLLKRMVSNLQTTYEAGADNTHCAYVTRRCAVLHYRAMLHFLQVQKRKHSISFPQFIYYIIN